MDARGADVAAVIMEPVMLNAGVPAAEPGYPEAVREICTQRGQACGHGQHG